MAQCPGLPRPGRASREATIAGFTAPGRSRFDGASMSSSPSPITDIDPEVILRNLPPWICLLYTSDAADERSSVDLGGRRIIKKKKNDEDESRSRMYYQYDKH